MQGFGNMRPWTKPFPGALLTFTFGWHGASSEAFRFAPTFTADFVTSFSPTFTGEGFAAGLWPAGERMG